MYHEKENNEKFEGTGVVTQDADSTYLTAEEVAGIFRVTPQTILNWVRAGRMRGLHLSPRVVRIPRSEVERHQARAAKMRPPHEMRETRPWQEVLAEFESYFGLSTAEMLRRRARGLAPPLESATDERMYEAWVAAAEVALSAGLLRGPEVRAAV